LEDYKKKCKQQIGIFSRVAKTNISSLTASYKVALELARCKKPFSGGLLVKKCAVEMVKAFGDTNMAKKFETVSLSHHTVARKVAAMSGHVAGKLSDVVEKCCYFSLCLDETVDQTDVTQLLIFVCTVQCGFSTQELNMYSLKGTTMGIDIYEAVKTTVDKFRGFDKGLSIVTVGAQAVVSHCIRFSGLLKKKIR
jgi:hypothetical protein